MNTVNPAEIARQAAADLAAAEQRLAGLAALTDARSVFTALALSRMLATETDGPGKHMRPMPAAIEYAAWLLFPHFDKATARDPEQTQTAIDAFEACCKELALAEVFPADGGEYDSLDTHLRLHSGMVRGSAYPQQLQRRITEVQGPFEADFKALAGIGPVRAVEVGIAIARQQDDNNEAMRQAFRTALAKGEAQMRDPAAVTVAEISAVRVEVEQILDGMHGAWVPTWAQIAARVPGLTRAEWDALRTILGLTPASRATLTRLVDVQDRPFYFLTDESVMLTGMPAVFDAVFQYFDALARRAEPLASRYGNQVAEWMESGLDQFLRRIFPAEYVIRSACFVDPDNPAGETEADNVVVFGPFLIVHEAKGKRVDPAALRGNRTKLRRNLASNIQDAFLQARRVVRVLERDGRIVFKEKGTGRRIEVEASALRRVMCVSVTLQHLHGIPTQLAATADLGLFRGRSYPWSVSVDDLDVITRFIGGPDAYLHYIERRIAHQSSAVGFTGDELDIFGQYLGNRLHPSAYEERAGLKDHDGPRRIAFHGGEDLFSPVYAAEWNGETFEGELPALKLPSPIAAVLRELRSRSDDDARWIAFELLSLSERVLLGLAGAMENLRKQQVESGRMQRITAREGDLVINVIVQSSFTPDEFNKSTVIRTRLEHYRARARATLTLGIDLRDAQHPFATCCWLEGEWRAEPLMEEMLGEDREQPRVVRLSGAATKVGRNDPCPCGSGQKFKRCCIDRMKFQRVT